MGEWGYLKQHGRGSRTLEKSRGREGGKRENIEDEKAD